MPVFRQCSGAYSRIVDIVEFLSARITEDEAAARKLLRDKTLSKSARWYEERLLMECAAKRRIIGIIEAARQNALATLVSNPFGEDIQWIPEALEWTTLSLNALALPYADHPEFEPDWLTTGRD